jgi:hypothetical protein
VNLLVDSSWFTCAGFDKSVQWLQGRNLRNTASAFKIRLGDCLDAERGRDSDIEHASRHAVALGTYSNRRPATCDLAPVFCRASRSDRCIMIHKEDPLLHHVAIPSQINLSCRSPAIGNCLPILPVPMP